MVELVDWGVFHDRVSRRYVVQPGDTLRGIAAARCGDAARWKVLVDANPAIAAAPDRIRAGDELWLPPPRAFDPVVPPPAGTDPDTVLEPWYDAFTLKHASRRMAAVADRTDVAPPARSATGSFLLVPHPDTAALLEALVSRPAHPGDPLLARAIFVAFGFDNHVHADEATVRLEVRTRLTGRDGGGVTRTQDVRRFDAEGRLVTTVVPLEEVDMLGRPLRPRPRPDADGLARRAPAAADADAAGGPPRRAGRPRWRGGPRPTSSAVGLPGSASRSRASAG